MNDERTMEIKENFDYFDRDGNGRIDFGEFRELMDALNAELTAEQARYGFDAIDSDGDGCIDLTEFQGWWTSR